MVNRGRLLSAMLLTAAIVVPPLHREIHRSVEAPEFLALHRLSDAELRARFALPPSCDPTLGAVRGVGGRFHVTIRCAQPPGPGYDLAPRPR